MTTAPAVTQTTRYAPPDGAPQLGKKESLLPLLTGKQQESLAPQGFPDFSAARTRAAERSFDDVARGIRKGMIRGVLPMSLSRMFCGAGPLPAYRRKKDGTEIETGFSGGIELMHDESGFFYHGLQHCHSPWCPQCVTTLASQHATDVQMLTEHLVHNDYRVVMLTLTAQHHRNTNLAAFSKSFRQAARYFWSHRTMVQLKKAMQYDGIMIQSTELTDDLPILAQKDKTGWHFHKHYVMFVESNFYDIYIKSKALEQLQKRIAQHWQYSLQHFGLTCNLKNGAHLLTSTTGDVYATTKMIAEYIASIEKQIGKRCTTDETRKIAMAKERKEFKKPAFELVGSAFKFGRAVDSWHETRRISYYELARLAATEYPQLLPRLGEAMRGLKGVSWVRMTPKARQILIELQNKKAKDKITGEQEEPALVYQWSGTEFRPIVAHAKQQAIIDFATEVKEGKTLRDVHLAIDDITKSLQSSMWSSQDAPFRPPKKTNPNWYSVYLQQYAQGR